MGLCLWEEVEKKNNCFRYIVLSSWFNIILVLVFNVKQKVEILSVTFGKLYKFNGMLIKLICTEKFM